jgi:CHAT domain-containing protein/Flp pilus assembly protein TadD
MPQLRKSFICLGVISVVAIVFASLLPSVKVSPIPRLPSRPEPLREVPQAPPKTFEPPTPQPFEQRLIAGVSHLYPLPMKEGDLLELIVDQKGVDVEVVIFDSLGKLLFTVDSPNGDQGPERVLLVARESASYRAQVSTFDPSGDGRYRIWIATQRRASPKEVQEARAEELFFQAKSTKEPVSSRETKLQEAARLWEQTGNDGRQADALRLLGILYAQRERHRESLEVWRQAKRLYHQARRLGDEGVVANDIGTSYFKLFELDLAAESHSEALTLGKRTGNVKIVGAALYNLGYISWSRGKYSEALEKLEPARIAAKRSLDKVLEGEALTALGLVFSSVGKAGMALEKFREALTLFETLGDEGQKAITLTQMGNAYVRSGDPEQAQEFYRKALEIQGHLQDEDNLLVTLNGLGLASLNQNQPQEALDFFLRSLQLARKTGNAAQEARIWTNLGWSYSELGRENDAYTAYEQALRLGERTESRGMKTAARLGLALLEEKRRNPTEARVQAESAVSSVEELREETSPDLKIAFIASQQDVYDVLIDILLWLHELRPSEGHGAQALRVSEQARSRGLLDKIRERSPHMPSTPQILSLREIQASLGPETLLLEYHLGRRASYLWLVEEASLQIVRLPPREEVEALAERARGLMVVSNRRERRSEARNVAADLSGMLLGSAVGSLGRKRLLISVPTALQSVPFPALPDPAALGPETRSEWPRPLIMNHEVVKIPSVSVLAALRAREGARPDPQGLLALLADPVFGLHDERLELPGVPFRQTRSEMPPNPLWGSFNRLTHAREEAESILGEVGPRGAFSAFGFDATRALVLSGRLRDFRNLHFATHGLLRSDAADLSALVLSQVDPQGRPQNGFLQAGEIYGLDLPADLVTLSACETGLGEKIPGEGLMGLPHAFFTAGATRVIVSLWAVNDLATANLMKRFYHEYLTRGLSPAAALREAQKAMWQSRQYNSPFYWGGFELQGDWRAVESPR